MDCTQKGQHISCIQAIPEHCTKGCVCAKGALRNRKGKCVPEDQCPTSCKGDPNAIPGCGINCGRLCSNYKHPGEVGCAQVCYDDGCDCKKGHVLDTNTGKCIKPDQCTPTCKTNEVFTPCLENVCRIMDCKQKGQEIACIQVVPDKCTAGCVCAPGTLKNASGDCVPEDQCPKNCPDNETLNTCPAQPCAADFCPKSRDSPQSCISTKNCGEPRCTCNFNQKRDPKGKCIAIRDCPPFKCSGPNEEYQGCPPVCPGETCSDFINKTTCPKFRIGIVVPCKPQCRCKAGHYRNSRKICIKASQCKNDNPGTTSPGTDNPTTDYPGTEKATGNVEIQQRFDNGLIDFSFDFLKELAKKNPGESVFSSALSVEAVLAPLALYAKKGSLTETELLKFFNLATKDEIRSAFKSTLEQVKSQNLTVNIANKVYVAGQYQLSDEFAKDNKEVLNSAAEELDVNNPPQAADKINKWVEQQTNDRIKNLISPAAINSLTRLILVNALYFKGNWLNQFDPKNTEEQDFYQTKDKTTKVQMMYQKKRFLYAENQELQAQVIELPYADEDYKMCIILPFDKEGLQATLDKINSNTVNAAIKGLVKKEVKVYLPKYKINTNIALIEILKSVGVTKIFDPSQANLIGILKQQIDLYVTDAIQQTFLEVNEEGSEAAAATAVIVSTLSAQINPSKENIFRADHPFAFVISNKNTILFGGLMNASD